jgi:hypothetical protein
MPEFVHDFVGALNNIGNKVTLDTREIEDAGVYEILQTPGAALGSWSILGDLLEPINEFRFKEQLGQAREVKTALSGLFGRFVARAYAVKYLGLNYFAHIHAPPMSLIGGLGVLRKTRPGIKADMPDWVAWGVAGGLAIVEAKGSYDKAGPRALRERAYKQAERARIMHGRKLANFNRYAVVTRWGSSIPAPVTDSMIYVRDPVTKGETSPEEDVELGIGIARRHFGALLVPLGQRELGQALFTLAEVGRANAASVGAAQRTALSQLHNAPRTELKSIALTDGSDGLIGGIVTRGGPLEIPKLSEADRKRLSRLNLKPCVVGVDKRMLEAVIKGDASRVKDLRGQAQMTAPAGEDPVASTDTAGSWIAPLGS